MAIEIEQEPEGVRDVGHVGGYITVGQAARLLQKKPSTVNYLLRNGNLTGVRLDGVILVQHQSVEAYREQLPTIEANREAERQRVVERRRLEQEQRDTITEMKQRYQSRISSLKEQR